MSLISQAMLEKSGVSKLQGTSGHPVVRRGRCLHKTSTRCAAPAIFWLLHGKWLLPPPADRSITQLRSDKLELLWTLPCPKQCQNQATAICYAPICRQNQLWFSIACSSSWEHIFRRSLRRMRGASGPRALAWPTFGAPDRNQEAHFLRCSLAARARVVCPSTC